MFVVVVVVVDDDVVDDLDVLDVQVDCDGDDDLPRLEQQAAHIK